MDQQPSEIEASSLECSEKRYRRLDVDTNQDQCFNCGKKGKLNCCQTCVRTFHQKCSPLKKNASGEWQCHICQLTRPCQFCGLKAQEPVSIVCTICCLASHSRCFMQYHNAPKELIEDSILKQSSYVCKGCLNKHGIKYIKQVARCGNAIEEKLVSLTQINYKSPVHFGIFKEKEVIEANQLFRNAKRPKGNTQAIMNSQHFSTFYKSIIIQKLIQIKIPKIYEAQKTKNIHSLLINEQRQRGLSFGSPNNFWFLIKWKHADYSHCTWQDQVIVSRLDPDKKHRLAFIRYEDPPRPQSKMNLIRLLRQNDIPWDQSIVYGAIIKASRYNMIYPIQVIDFNLVTRALSFVCYCLAHSIAIERCNQISIIISSLENIQHWRKCLTEMKPVIDFVEFGGSQANMHAIKMKALNNYSRSKFHVLLMTFETFQREQKFFASKMGNVAFLILQYHRLSVEIAQHNKARNTVLLAKSGMGKKDFLMELRQAFKDTFIFWNNICLNSAEVIPPYDFTFNSLNINGQSEHIKYFKVYSIREEKRIAIIRFILRFGIPTDNLKELYSLMKAFEPTIFTLHELKGQTYQTFQVYIRSLMILLSIHSEVYLGPLAKLYYLINVDPSRLQARLLNCQKLRTFIKQEGSLSLPASVMKDTSSNSLGEFTSWKAEDDCLLIKLVIEYGYDNWQVIFNCKDWCKHVSNPHNRHLTFLAYLKLRVIILFKVNTADYLDFVENRIELICKYL